MTDAEGLIRQITINQITDSPNPILDWFNDLWVSLTMVETTVYHPGYPGAEILYYINSNSEKICMFYIDNKTSQFMCNNELYWNHLKTITNLESDGIRILSKFLFKTVMELGYVIIKPLHKTSIDSKHWEKYDYVMVALNKI